MHIAAGLGVVAGFAFHHWDGQNYVSAGALTQLNSRSKWAHDFVAYPVLLGGVAALLMPLIYYCFRQPHHQAVFTNLQLALYFGLGGWFLMGILDMMIFKPSPLNMHPPGAKW